MIQHAGQHVQVNGPIHTTYIGLIAQHVPRHRGHRAHADLTGTHKERMYTFFQILLPDIGRIADISKRMSMS